MPLPLAKNQIRKLGDRLRNSEVAAAEDLELLYELLESYQQAMDDVAETLKAQLSITPPRRLKTTGTIVDKLKRNRTAHLANIQDLAGVRIVLDTFDRREQDRVTGAIANSLSSEDRSPKVIDRRVEPMHGYRAVHVVAVIDGVPVEIQIRTTLQHEWAEIFEKMADVYGRGIRYGEPPYMPPLPTHPEDWMLELRARERRVRETSIDLAQAISECFNAIEGIPVENHDDEQLQGMLIDTRRSLAELGERMREYVPIGGQREDDGVLK